MTLEITPFFEKQSCTWTYLVADTLAGVAAIIDPVWVYDPVTGRADASFTERVLSRARKKNWTIEWVLETHAHADHLSSGGLIRAKTGARIAIGRGITGVEDTFARVYNLPQLRSDGGQFDRLVSEGDEIVLGNLALRVLETPGHTDDSVTWLVRDAAFVGDTLFEPEYGTARCDFPGGDAGRLFDSIQRIYELPGATRLFLCHDYAPEGQEPRMMVTVEESRRCNIHVSDGTTRDSFIGMREARDASLPMPRLMLAALQVNVLGGQAPPPESNGFSYLKIPFDTSIAEILAGRK